MRSAAGTCAGFSAAVEEETVKRRRSGHLQQETVDTEDLGEEQTEQEGGLLHVHVQLWDVWTEEDKRRKEGGKKRGGGGGDEE